MITLISAFCSSITSPTATHSFLNCHPLFAFLFFLLLNTDQRKFVRLPFPHSCVICCLLPFGPFVQVLYHGVHWAPLIFGFASLRHAWALVMAPHGCVHHHRSLHLPFPFASATPARPTIYLSSLLGANRKSNCLFLSHFLLSLFGHRLPHFSSSSLLHHRLVSHTLTTTAIMAILFAFLFNR